MSTREELPSALTRRMFSPLPNVTIALWPSASSTVTSQRLPRSTPTWKLPSAATATSTVRPVLPRRWTSCAMTWRPVLDAAIPPKLFAVVPPLAPPTFPQSVTS